MTIKHLNRNQCLELSTDLDNLRTEHGINDELILSLKALPAEARAHIRFFKRMMWIFNGIPILIGMFLLGLGVRGLLPGFNVFSLVLALCGGFICFYMSGVVRRQIAAIRAVEITAARHNLL